MGPSGALARTWLRRNVVATVALVVLVALASGAVSGAFAAARRSSSALDRFLHHNKPPTLQVYGESIDLEAVKALPQVAGATEGAYGLMTVESAAAGPFPPGVINPFIRTSTEGERQFRPYVVDGVEPSVSAADEVAIDEDAAARLEVGVGDRLRLEFFVPEQIEELYEAGGSFPVPRGGSTEVVVTAIVRHPFDLNPAKPDEIDAVSLASADIHLYEGFWAANGDRMAAFGSDGEGVELLLRDGAEDVPAVEAAIRAMPGGADVAVEQRNDSIDAIRDARQTVQFEAVALVVFGVLTSLVGLVVVGQAIARQLRSELAQRGVLAAVGLTRRDLAVAAMARSVVVGTAGGGAGVLVAFGSSTFTPIGFGRRAEITPGASFDAAIMVAAAMAAAVLVVAWSGWIGWRGPTGGAPATLGLGRRLSSAAARMGAPLPVVTGLSHLTGQTRHGGRTPLRSSLGALVFATGAVVAVSVFTTSLDRFVEVPAEHGWTWDLIVGDADDPKVQAEGAELLAANERVSGYAAVWTGYEEFVSVDGFDGDVAVAGVESLAGGTGIAIIDGAMARGPDEVVLGTRTLGELGLDIGEEVTFTGPRDPVTYRVVGTAVLHELVGDGFELDEGAVLSAAGLGRVFSGAEGVRVSDTDFGEGTIISRYLVDVAEGVPVGEAAASIRRDFGPTIVPHVPPLDVAGLEGTQSLPLAFALLVAFLGGASLVHLLVVTVGRRRRELAVLSTLGARRGQLAATVACLATSVALVAVLVGVPAGLVAGRTGWNVLAAAIGAPTPVLVPAVTIAVATVGVVVVANVVAAVPARSARRLRPADVLRGE